MSVEPWINWQFHKTPGHIDPRAVFTRAGIGRVTSRIGLVAPVPANTARYRFHPVTGLSEGLLVEAQRTNLLLRSEEFENIAWTATNLSVTANSTTAPDGTTTADTLAATAAGGKLAQAVTITAGRGIALGVYAKANASSWVRHAKQLGAPSLHLRADLRLRRRAAAADRSVRTPRHVDDDIPPLPQPLGVPGCVRCRRLAARP